MELRNSTLQISDIDDDFEIEIKVVNPDDMEASEVAYVNESQAKQIVEHFKNQFGWT